MIKSLKNSFNLTWLRVQISYHIFNNLAELLNGDLTTKIGRGIFSKDLMDRKCNCSLNSKVNRKCAYEGKCRSRCIIYEVTCSMCDAIYIGNTHQTFRKRMDGNFSDLQRLLKMDKNQTRLLPTSYSTLTIPRHVRIYVSVRRSR